MAEVANQRVDRAARTRGDQLGLSDDIREQKTPEAILDETKTALEERDKQVEESERRRREAEAALARSNADKVTAQEREINLQGVALENAISAAEARQTAATAAWRTAREANDIDAEQAAVREMTGASAAVENAKGRKQAFDTWKAQRPKTPQPDPRQQQQQEPYTPQVKDWLGRHPAYFKPGEYRDNAQAAAELALMKLGREKEGTQEYVDFVDRELTAIYGADHGKLTPARKVDTRTEERDVDDNRASSRATPPSRDSVDDFRRGGDFSYSHPGGTLRLTQQKDRETGEMKDVVVGQVPPEWKEAAKWSKMPLVDYCVEQMGIQREIKEGGAAAGLVTNRNGVYE